MPVFGLISSLFDLLTFVLLVKLFHAGPALFHSGWFVVSLLTELAVAALAVALPLIAPAAHLFGFVPMPASMVAMLIGLTLACVAATEAAKRWFWWHGITAA